jgi:DNA-binding ferritin-like protein (Dps family)
MTMSLANLAAKLIGDKRRWRQYKARTRKLPDDYRATVEALERYMMQFGPADGNSAVTMFEDLADLFEEAVADGTPIRSVVGEDPVEFVEAFLQNYRKGGWLTREQDRLTTAIDSITGDGTSTQEPR